MANRIRVLRKARGLSQTELGNLLGTSKQQVHNLEKGKRKLSEDWLKKLSTALQVPISSIMEGVSPFAQETLPPPESFLAAPLPMIEGLPRDVPVLGTGVAGEQGDFALNGETVDWVRRPPALVGVKGCFALYIQGESMINWRQPGGLIYVHPARPPKVGDHVLVELKAPPGEPKPAYCKRLLKVTGKALILGQYNPPRDDIAIPRERVAGVYRIMEWEELLGV